MTRPASRTSRRSALSAGASSRAGADDLARQLVHVMRAHDDDVDVPQVGRESAHDLETAELRHADVEQHDVRLERVCQLQSLAAIDGLTADDPVVLRFDHQADAAPQVAVVIRN